MKSSRLQGRGYLVDGVNKPKEKSQVRAVAHGEGGKQYNTKSYKK